MAVVGTNLTSDKSAISASSFNTASISPSVNNLLLLTCAARRTDSTQPVAPTVTGNGLTWVKVNEIYFDTDSTSRKTLFVFRSLGPSPSSGVVTMDYGTQTITQTTWSVDQFSGIDISGTNGSGAIVQSATATDVDGGGFTITLNTFSNINNATFGGFADDSTTTAPTAGSGFTLLGSNDGTTTFCQGTEWKSTNDTSVDMVFGSALGGRGGGIAIEIKSAKYTTTFNDYQFVSAGNGISVSERIR